MFSHASNFRIDGQPTFIVYQGSAQDTNQDISLRCSQVPSPKSILCGAADTLSKLAKVFSAPVVTVFDPDPDSLARFVRSFSRRPTIYIDATSEETLTNALAENPQDFESIYSDIILVLENVYASLVLDEHFPVCLQCPILVTSTDSTVSIIASSFARAFQLPKNSSNKSAMAKCWAEIQRALMPGQRIVSLVASGGTGKTQTVSWKLLKLVSIFSNIWFFDATSKETLTSDFKELAKAAGVGDQIKDICNFLARSHENWMCIFDSADDEQLYLKDYLPICAHGNIIITSRLVRTSEMDSPGCHIGFFDLNKDDAIKLLLKHAHEESHEETQKVASEIVEALGCQALAVSTAGAYIHTNATCNLGNYLTRFNNKKRDTLNYRLRTLDNYQRTVFSAFQLSFEKLSLASQSLIQMCLGYIFGDGGFWIQKEVLNEEMLAISKEVIGEHHPDTLVSMNDLALTYHALGKLESAQNLGEEVLVLNKKVIGEHHPDTLASMGNLALTYCTLGKLESAQKLQEEVLMLCKKVIGEHHPHTLTSMANLSATYHGLRKLDSAQKLDEEVLVLRKKVIGEHHPDTLVSMNNLALAYHELGKLESAQQLEEEVLVLHKDVIGEHHPYTLSSMAHLASTYRGLGKLASAQKLEEEVLVLRKKVSGEHHPDTLTSMGNLALTYHALGKLETAQKLEEEVLVLCKKVIGAHHPDTLTSMANLGSTYCALGKFESAQKLEEGVLVLRQKIIGEHHSDTLTSMANLACTYCALGKLESAQKLQEEALALRKMIIGEHHPHTLISMGNLALTYRALGKLESAQKLEEEELLLQKSVA
ncbi:hypothetical protein BDP27DRAFT_1372451 [Rhodocollybia butyracea]|uniref:Kinesin light chain n=1 Tax=Rhodocollybia butyracea TaxID=206335 RepID=A0A9P5TXR6_9AGAR|nr:hypothetical protein BDP27DRAFT_1372451 [Rhodocollybia butyracea]